VRIAARTATGVFVLSVFAAAACTRFAGIEPPASQAEPEGGGPVDGSVDSNEASGHTDGAPDAALCLPATCTSAPGSCRAFTFTDAVCPPEWTKSGDSNTTVECTNGALRIRAANTLDVFASLTLAMPENYSGVRISGRFTLEEWAALRFLQLSVGGTVVAELFAGRPDAGPFVIGWCRDDCDEIDSAAIAFATPHVFTFDLSTSRVTLSIDCEPIASRPLAPLSSSAALVLKLGSVDASPLDGVFDDISVAFR
jgi:hypothetical protein